MSSVVIKLQLKTDFCEEYDKFFDKKADRFFERIKTAPFSREDCFYYLNSLGMLTPTCGIIETLVPALFEVHETDSLLVVVYKDVFLHDRRQLLLVDAKRAFNIFKKSFACEYLKGDEEHATTYTYLKIGQRSFGVKTVSVSKECWQSNVVYKTTIVCQGAKEDYHPKIDFPLFSIDYISCDKKLYAIDFNIAPTLKDTNINLFMGNDEIFEEIAQACTRFSKSKHLVTA